MSESFLQQTREFTNSRAATHFIMRLRELFGTKAKCFLRSQSDRTFVKFKVPTGKPLPNSGKVIGDGEVWN